MPESSYLSLFLIGLLGGTHCVGMCGGIVGALSMGAGEYVSDNALNVYVKRLREKVETDPAEPELIVTVRGLGYKVGE